MTTARSRKAKNAKQAKKPRKRAGKKSKKKSFKVFDNTDFEAYLPQGNYVCGPTRELWGPKGVDASLPRVKIGVNEDGSAKTISASRWLDRHRPVQQMTWMPGLPQIVTDHLVSDGGWIEHPGARVFNLYREPQIVHGDSSKAHKWIEHLHRVYPTEAEHIILWLAHRVQKPQEKINHALVLGGTQGIGKDTILEPVKYAIGPWNFAEVSPAQLLGRFNGFIKSVILRVSEARDLGSWDDRMAFYDHVKMYEAAPPDVLRCDEKNIREHAVFNVMGVIITTNHKTDGIYLPSDDRRHFVAWSDLSKEDFTDVYWNDLWHWYRDDGIRHVVAYLAGLDLSGFQPKTPPPKTAAFWAIVAANRAPEDGQMADAIEACGNPDALTVDTIASCTQDYDFRDWLKDRRNARQLPYRLEVAGYVVVRNPATTDGRWKVDGNNRAVYARNALSISQRFEAVNALVRARRSGP